MIRLLKILKTLFTGNSDTSIWCLVANVKENPKHLANKLLRGTKHFGPGAKVYCFPPQWGDGYEHVRVIGRQRVSKKYICIIMSSKKLENWRLERVYSPYVIRRMREMNGWTDKRGDRKRIEKMIAVLNRTS